MRTIIVETQRETQITSRRQGANQASPLQRLHECESAMPKSILIFSDGTGQVGGLTPDQNISNIYKLYRATRCGPENNIDPSQQLTFYDPGLGSQPNSGILFVTRTYRWLHDVVSQATGLVITTNIIDCYAALSADVAAGRSHLSFRL